MAQVPECVVCLQPYDDFRHLPRVLACGHSFCELCLMQLQSAWPSLASDKESPSPGTGAVIRCPECSHRTRLPVGGQQCLPKNVELLRLLPSLIKEENAPEGGNESAPGRKSGGRKGVQGKQNNRGVSRRAVAEDGAGSRRSVDRRPSAKGKQRVDSNFPAGSVAGTNSVGGWLTPCDLYSENFNADVRTWIVPERAIKLREEDSPRVRPIDSSGREFLCGDIVLEQDRLSSSMPVTLLQLEESFPEDETLSYEHFILKAWEGFRYEAKTELLMLFRVSLLCRRVCHVFGLWMNKRRQIFLVSQVPAHEGVSAWETILKSCRDDALPAAKSKDVDEKREADESASVRDDISLSAGAMNIPPELRKRPPQDVSAAATMGMVNRVGVGLCEALLDVHSQGVIFGHVSPNCFVLDQFGTLLIDVDAALDDRSSVREAATRLNGADGHVDSQNSRNCWQYMSPEALSLVINNSADLEHCNETGGNGSSASDQAQGLLTCKADVWSLGCLLLELLSRKAPYEGLTFPEVVQKVLVERDKPGDFLSLDYDLCMDIENQGDVKSFKNLLSKCFEFDPDQRPELGALWLNLVELRFSKSIPNRKAGEHLHSQPAGSADQKYWILCLPGFILDGHLDSWHGRKTEIQESQRRLELLRLDNGAADNGRELQAFGLEQEGSLDGHKDYVTALVVCGEHLLSASFDKTIRVWSLEDHELQQTLEGHSHVVAALAVDHNSFRCFSGDSGGKICAWKLGEDTSEPLIASWQEHDDWRYTGVASLAVSADGILYSGSGDRTIKAWSLQNFVLLGTMEGHSALVSSLLVDGELLYSGSWDGTIHVWWRNDHSLVAVLGGGASAVPSLGGVRTLCMSDSFLFAGRDSGAVQVWRDEECLATVKAHDMIVSTLYVEGDYLYTGSWDEQIKAWKVDKFLSDPSPTLVKKCGSTLSSLVSDGDKLYAGLADRSIKIYSLLGDTWASLVQMLNP